MIYMRGQHKDYDDWADRYGCDGWSYDDVLPVFKLQEKNTRLSGEFHGDRGKLIVDDPEPCHPVNAAFIKAAVVAGVPRNDDFNGAHQEGVGWYQVNALDSEQDMDTLRRGVRLATRIFEQSPLREFIGESVWPSNEVSLTQGSNTLDEAIRTQARTIFHPAGTCRMGSDENSVVDTQLRVRGIDNLRVADCSIMPAITTGNTNAPTMMIADRCADFILAEG